MFLDTCLTSRGHQVRDGKAAYYVRAAALAAGFPNTTASSSTARFCSSGLKATQDVANQIAAGNIEVGVAVGAEYLSTPIARLDRPFVDEILNASQEAADCMQPMGQTSENVANDFNITREMQDEYAVESYRRAEVAQKAGWFDDEIVPITVNLDGKEVRLDRDDCLRHVRHHIFLEPLFNFSRLASRMPSRPLNAADSSII